LPEIGLKEAQAGEGKRMDLAAISRQAGASAPISGLPEIGTQEGASRVNPTSVRRIVRQREDP